MDPEPRTDRQSYLLDLLGRMPRWLHVLVSAATIGALAGVDITTGHEISFSIFYLVPVLYATWFAGLSWGVLLAVLAAATWGMADIASGARYSSAWIPVWNSLVRLGFFLIATNLLHTLRRADARMRGLAHTDAVTGLDNARSFYAELEREIARQRRQGSAFAIAYIDLDHFKEVNDARGHAAGDELLRAVGIEISDVVRASDIVARLGGDEFGVLLPDTGAEAASSTLARIHASVTELMGTATEVPGAGATIGAVVFERLPESSDDAVRSADELMYEAKRLGRGILRLAVNGESGLIERADPEGDRQGMLSAATGAAQPAEGTR